MMFCALTNHLIKKTKASVEEHLRGKKFAKAKGMYAVVDLSSERKRKRDWMMLRTLTIFRI